MSDIVERLRERAKQEYEMLGDIHLPLLEAADEITTLRAEVAQNAIDLEEYRRDVERLKAALQVFACDCALHERCAVPDNCRNFRVRKTLGERTKETDA